MRVDEFITETLQQIVTGVTQAQAQVADTGAKVNPQTYRAERGETHAGWISVVDSFDVVQGHMQMIDFDIAVTASEGAQAKGGIGVFVAAAALGGQTQLDNMNSTVTRIRFSVPVMLPTQPLK